MNAEISAHLNYLKAAFDNNGITSDVGKQKLTPALVGARVYKSSLQTITNATLSAINFDSERFDSDAFHDTVTNTQRFTIPSGMGGYYWIGAACVFAGNATGIRRLRLRLNGLTFIASQGATANAVDMHLNVSCLYQLAAADYVEAIVQQTSGANLDILIQDNEGAEFYIHRLSST